MIILAIDPSAARRTGWATYNTLTHEWEWGDIPIEGFNFKVRCQNLVDSISATVGEFEQLVCEWPTFYGSQRGHIAAQQGYTINLAGVVMFIAGWFHVAPRDLTLYTAPVWKGSVPKQVTARRFFKIFKIHPRSISHDTIDAVMMLYYHIQQLIKNGTLS